MTLLFNSILQVSRVSRLVNVSDCAKRASKYFLVLLLNPQRNTWSEWHVLYMDCHNCKSCRGKKVGKRGLSGLICWEFNLGSFGIKGRLGASPQSLQIHSCCISLISEATASEYLHILYSHVNVLEDLKEPPSFWHIQEVICWLCEILTTAGTADNVPIAPLGIPCETVQVNCVCLYISV